MANHCYNYASVSGAKDSLDKLEQAIAIAKGDADHLWWESFKSVFPNKKYQTNDVYTEFGSKWFECEIERDSDYTMTICGDSAWSPVSSFLLKLSKEFNLIIHSEYEEPGMDFAGWFECSNGNVVRDEQVSFRVFMDIQDPGRGLEQILEEVHDNIYQSFEEWLEGEDKALLNRLTDEHKKIIKDEFDKRM